MKKNVSLTVRELIEDTVAALGYTIWDITYRKIGGDYQLEITIDSEGGIGIDDTVRVTEAINPILDDADPIPGFYYLAVSSPGAERELRTDEHLERYLGAEVDIKLFTALDGLKAFSGKLAGFTDDEISLDIGESTVTLPRRDISKISLTLKA